MRPEDFPFTWKCEYKGCDRQKEIAGYGWIENENCPVDGINSCYILFAPEVKTYRDENGIEQPGPKPEPNPQLKLL